MACEFWSDGEYSFWFQVWRMYAGARGEAHGQRVVANQYWSSVQLAYSWETWRSASSVVQGLQLVLHRGATTGVLTVKRRAVRRWRHLVPCKDLTCRVNTHFESACKSRGLQSWLLAVEVGRVRKAMSSPSPSKLKVLTNAAKTD